MCVFLINWRLITLQYCSGFCHTLTWISHGFTCIPHPDPPSHLPLYPIPVEKTFESPLDCKEIQAVNPKGNQSWIFIGRTDAEAETPILWPLDAKNRLTGKDPDAGRDWGQEEKGTTGRDGWMASPTRWAWVWVSSGSWWWTGKPGVLRSMGSQRVGHDWTELNWMYRCLSKPRSREPGQWVEIDKRVGRAREGTARETRALEPAPRASSAPLCSVHCPHSLPPDTLEPPRQPALVLAHCSHHCPSGPFWKFNWRKGFPHSSVGKESACNAGDPGSIPGSRRSLGEETGCPLQYSWASLVAQLVKNPPAVRETWVWSLGWEDPLEKGKATHSSTLAWRIAWTV